jgi:hypothetical protein
MDTFRTLIIEESEVDLARQLCALEAGGAGMFTTGLSADGKPPASHYISSGLCPKFIAAYGPLQVWEQQEGEWVMVDSIPGNPEAVYKASQDADPPLDCTLSDIETLFTDSDMTQQEPFTAMGRMGLVIVQPEPEPETVAGEKE